MKSMLMEANLDYSAAMTRKTADVALLALREMYGYHGHELELRTRRGPRRRKGDRL